MWEPHRLSSSLLFDRATKPSCSCSSPSFSSSSLLPFYFFVRGRRGFQKYTDHGFTSLFPHATERSGERGRSGGGNSQSACKLTRARQAGFKSPKNRTCRGLRGSRTEKVPERDEIRKGDRGGRGRGKRGPSFVCWLAGPWQTSPHRLTSHRGLSQGSREGCLEYVMFCSLRLT